MYNNLETITIITCIISTIGMYAYLKHNNIINGFINWRYVRKCIRNIAKNARM